MTPPVQKPLDAARRELLRFGAAATSATLFACGRHSEAEVTPGEDLMQEHGVLQRVVIIYDTAALRIEQGQQLDPGVITKAAGIVRHFVEDYHERTEEKFVFPRLQAAGREAVLVGTLLKQHQRGRELTDELNRLAGGGASPALARVLRSFAHMYRAHASREDTVIFPAFRALLDAHEYEELGEQFEEREHQLVGEHGFENAVAEVARLEAQLGIADLAAFTPA
jgi:hemerythrin-like domain-containing protein